MIFIKGFVDFISLVFIVIVLHLFVTAVQVPIAPTTVPDYIDDRLPNVKRYDCTIAIIDRDGIEHHFMMDENGEPIFDEVDKDYTNSIYRDYLSYKKR